MSILRFVKGKLLLKLDRESDHATFHMIYSLFRCHAATGVSFWFDIGKDEKVHMVVDSGTGTTAVGLALGAVCLGCV